MTDLAKVPPLAADTSPETRTPEAKAAAPSRRAKVFAAILGALLLCVGAWLLWIFAEDPAGELSWFPGTWKGAPLILGACFGGVYGALLLFLRRFSLRGMLLCSILSAALACGLTAYVQTITETQTLNLMIIVHEDVQDRFIREAPREITQARIVRFLEALHAEGKLERGPDFNAVTFSYRRDPDNSVIDCTLKFEFLTFVDPRHSSVRHVAAQYAGFLQDHFALDVNKASSWGKDLKTGPAIPEELDVWVRLAQCGIEFHLDATWAELSESDFLIPPTSDPSFDALLGRSQEIKKESNAQFAKALNPRLQWLIEHESNPVFIEQMKMAQALLVEWATNPLLKNPQ